MLWTIEYVVVVQSLSHAWLFATPWTVAHQAPLSIGFSRQKYWSGLPEYMVGAPKWYCYDADRKISQRIWSLNFEKEKKEVEVAPKGLLSENGMRTLQLQPSQLLLHCQSASMLKLSRECLHIAFTSTSPMMTITIQTPLSALFIIQHDWLYPGQSIRDLKKKKIRRQVFLAPRVTSGNIIRFEENGHHAAIFLLFVSSVAIAVNTVGRSFKNQMSSSHLTHP